MKTDPKKTTSAAHHHHDPKTTTTQETAMNTKTADSITHDHAANPTAGAPIDLATATDPHEQAAYRAILPAARALDPKDLLQLNIDIPTAVSTCLAVAKRLSAHRPFLATLPAFDMADFDDLGTAALALTVAHADYLSASAYPDTLAVLLERGGLLFKLFDAWGNALAHSELVAADRVEAIRLGPAHRDLAVALTSYIRVFQTSDWVRIKEKSVLTDALIDEAESISQRILAILGDRELMPQRVAAASDLRQRVFTICVRHYDAVRRGVLYMRWHEGDGEELAPSLYAKGPRTTPAAKAGNSGAGNGTRTDAGHPAPAAPNGAPLPGSASPVTTAPTAPAPRAPSPPVQSVGLPDSNPFTTP
ncbi:MAG: hypothetical protein WCJ30_02445 [Deltaproteobacteria bacterium]